MSNPALSRRNFSKLMGLGAAYAAINSLPISNFRLPIGNSAQAATSRATTIVRLSSNENPYGPPQAALKAMSDGFSLAWRYPDEYADKLANDIANLHNVSSEEIILGNGSGEILKLCAAAFTSRERKLVVANPTFEALGRHAGVAGADVVKIGLTPDYRHDLEKMLAAANGAGLVYICNPNNPTASITPKEQVANFLAKISPSTMILVDEAYHHYVESKDYESVIPLVRQYPNLIVARTFSKIYGMAGMRCGYGVTQGATIGRLRIHQISDSVNILALLAAQASLKDADHVPRSRRINSEARNLVYSQLDSLGYRYIPSHANFLMIDLRREVRPVIRALRSHNVEVGRVFPTLPNHLRVTIGSGTDMNTFLTAFKQVMA